MNHNRAEIKGVASEVLRRWKDDPLQMVRDQFEVEPDNWQREVLEVFPFNQRIAMKACKGPGKTTILAWLIWNFLLTRPFPNIAATSITKDNLNDGLWKELSKWQQRSKLLQSLFEWQKTRIVARDSDLAPNWFCSARNWSKDADTSSQAATLAGLHADYIMFVIDESGGVPNSVMSTAEAALSSCVEGHILQAGNPIMLEGPLYRACTIDRRFWHVVEISADPNSPNRTPRVTREWAQQQIDMYGRDNPFVLVNVFGQFPPSSINALISADEIDSAMLRVCKEHELELDARVLGVDVARFGDDRSVIFPRQGLQLFNHLEYRNLDGIQGAAVTGRKIIDWKADATFIDDTGGFGSSWIDQLGKLGHSCVPVNFSSAAHKKTKFYNKRAEMALDAVEWIKHGGALSQCDELKQQILATTYTFDKAGNRLLIEPKESVKLKLGGQSPDHFDAFILTFAEPVTKQARKSNFNRHQFEYDPYDDLDRAMRT